MITASIVLYKTKLEDLNHVLTCAQKSEIKKVFVIDNSPDDSLRKWVADFSDKVEYQQGHGNIGYGRAHNMGFRKADAIDSDYHIVLNPDISFDPDTISYIKELMDRHSEIGLVLPKVLYPNGELQYLCKLFPTPFDIFGRRFLPHKIIAKRNNRFEMREMGYDKMWNCPILSGCFMFMRVSDLLKVTGFDEMFFMYFEDFDLMRRLHGITKTVFFPDVTIVHNHAAEHHTNKALLKASLISAIKYFNKWGWIVDRERLYVNRHAFDISNHIID